MSPLQELEAVLQCMEAGGRIDPTDLLILRGIANRCKAAVEGYADQFEEARDTALQRHAFEQREYAIAAASNVVTLQTRCRA